MYITYPEPLIRNKVLGRNYNHLWKHMVTHGLWSCGSYNQFSWYFRVQEGNCNLYLFIYLFNSFYAILRDILLHDELDSNSQRSYWRSILYVEICKITAPLTSSWMRPNIISRPIYANRSKESAWQTYFVEEVRKHKLKTMFFWRDFFDPNVLVTHPKFVGEILRTTEPKSRSFQAIYNILHHWVGR